MKIQTVFILSILLIMAACNNKKGESPAQWSETEVSEWYSEGEWQHGFNPIPDESINQREMAIQYYRNPEQWKKAFKFLTDQNLQALDTGRHELEGTELYATVHEYIPKAADSVDFESHRKYAHLEYVASGQEKISMLPINETIITTPYNEEKDVVYLSAIEADERIATPEKFFVFFPTDAYQPSVKVNPQDSTHVKKIVVKIKLYDLPREDNP